MYDYDVIVIGSGPGGYVSAIKGAQLGLKVACIEKDELGGICLNWGCIPTKAIIKSVDMYNELKSARRFGLNPGNAEVNFAEIMKRSRMVAKKLSKGVEFLFKKYGVTRIRGKAKLVNDHTIEISESERIKRVTAKNIIIATGGIPVPLPKISPDTDILSSKQALSLQELPESIIIIGSGAIGVEFAYILSSLGTKVCLIELLPEIIPMMDEDVSQKLANQFKKVGIKIFTGTRVNDIQKVKGKLNVKMTVNGQEETISSEKVLMSIGVKGNYNGLGLEQAGVETDNGFIKVDNEYKTSVPNIHAIGDVIGPPALAHVASREGLFVIEKLAGGNPEPVNYGAIPSAIYTKPQIASVGLTEKEAQKRGIEYHLGKFPFSANGKCVASGDIYGFVKVLFDRKNDSIIGAQIVGHEASELIHVFVSAINMKLKYKNLKDSVFAHPTASEAIHEAILASFNEQIHI